MIQAYTLKTFCNRSQPVAEEVLFGHRLIPDQSEIGHNKVTTLLSRRNRSSDRRNQLAIIIIPTRELQESNETSERQNQYPPVFCAWWKKTFCDWKPQQNLSGDLSRTSETSLQLSFFFRRGRIVCVTGFRSYIRICNFSRLVDILSL